MNDNVFYMRNCNICPSHKLAALRVNQRLDLGNKIMVTDVMGNDSANNIIENYYGGRRNVLTPTAFIGSPILKNGKPDQKHTAIISVINQKHTEIIMRILKGVYF